jgi:mRNA interferase RelE/StbE
MAYELLIDKQAGNALAKLPKDHAVRIFSKIKETKENPERYWIRLEGRNDYKLRVGDYRVIADIDPCRKTIQVTKIGHRKKIYDS